MKAHTLPGNPSSRLMPVRLPLLWLVAVWSFAGGWASAQPPVGVTAGDHRQEATSHLAVLKQPTGEPVLVISYPWKVHLRPSIEVRLITGKAADLSDVRPLFFVKEYMKGAVTVNVYHCLDRAAGVPQRHAFTENGIDLEILGRRNSLGRPSVCVTRRIPAEDPAPGAAAVFCLLPSWAVDKGLLRLELPPDYFGEAGRIYVWFLRGGKVLWEERADWPGYDKD